MLHLYVWGSAFGLPSIDPECLATITYLHNASPTTKWRIVPCNDPSISPANLLPALYHNGSWSNGFRPIVDYLTRHSLCRDLDESLTSSQKANSVAYSAFLASNAAPLLDLSLCVSAANWTATTRPAYSKLLRFPLTWTVPPLIRAEAIKRTDHLGLAELDTDFDPNGSLHLTAGRDALPETFRRHLPSVGRKTVKEEMTPEQAAAIKLFGLTEDCMSTLCDILVETGGDNPQSSRRQLSSLDCLAFGYLSLMRDAPVPRSFLKDWMTQKASRLSIFVDDMKLDYLQNLDDLPFDTSPPATALDISVRTLDSALLNVPEVGVRYAEDKRVRAEEGTTGYLNGRPLALVTCMVAGAALVYARQVYMALPPFGARTQAWNRHRGTRLSEYGDLGFMMQNLGPVYSPPASMSAPTGRVVQTDSEVD